MTCQTKRAATASWRPTRRRQLGHCLVWHNLVARSVALVAGAHRRGAQSTHGGWQGNRRLALRKTVLFSCCLLMLKSCPQFLIIASDSHSLATHSAPLYCGGRKVLLIVLYQECSPLFCSHSSRLAFGWLELPGSKQEIERSIRALELSHST